MTRIVIVGAGIAGVPAAYLIKAKLGGQAALRSFPTKIIFILYRPTLGLRWAGESVTTPLSLSSPI